MKVSDILKTINLGSIVAESDPTLNEYFIQTEAYNALIRGAQKDKKSVDFIFGDKGAGKTAIFEYITRNYKKITELRDNNIEIVPAINPKGSLIFQRIKNFNEIDEEAFISIWKWYIFWLVGNRILEIYQGSKSRNLKNLKFLLSKLNMQENDPLEYGSFFNRFKRIGRYFNIGSLRFELSYDPIANTFNLVGKLDSKSNVTEIKDEITPDQAIKSLVEVITLSGNIFWIAFDQVDVIFPIYSSNTMNYKAIKGLLRTYIDMKRENLECLGMKVFMRTDQYVQLATYLPGSITITAHKHDISWDEKDLYFLLLNRIKKSSDFISIAASENIIIDKEFAFLLPKKIGNSKSWNWIILHIRDALGITAPRNLLDIIIRAISYQLKYDARDFHINTPLIEQESFKSAFISLSKQRLEDTLICENPLYGEVILKFVNQKFENNKNMIMKIIGGKDEEIDETIKYLKSIGFLEEVEEELYQIPLLYRPSLSIKNT